MVNWKAPDATDRLFASLLASNPGIRLDYHSMATMFGQGASYDAIEGRFRRYRKIADELRSEAQARGVDISRAGAVPRTPRGPRSRVSKPTPSSSSSKRGKKLDFDKEDMLESPTKGKGKTTTNAIATGKSDVICLDVAKSPISQPEAETKNIKTEAEARFLPLTSPSSFSWPTVKCEKQDDMGFDIESVAHADFSNKVKTEPGISVICGDEDSDGTA